MIYSKICDLSYCQSAPIDWRKLKELNLAVIARSGQGVYEDTLFRQHYANAQAAGVPFGMYHFYQPDQPADPQVKSFLQIYYSLQVKPAVIALDVEDIVYTEPDGTKVDVKPPSPVVHSAWLQSWLKQVSESTGIIPGVYTRANYWNAWTVRAPIWSRYWLWVASWTFYSGAVPILPADWTDWLIWQYEGGLGRQEGITGPVDLDWFAGDLSALRIFFNVDSPALPTIPPPETPPGEPPADDTTARLTRLEWQVGDLLSKLRSV